MTVIHPIAIQDIPHVASPQADCCYCWYTINPGKSFPEDWSSTICQAHADWQVSRLAQRRRADAAQRSEVNFVLVESDQLPDLAPWPYVNHRNHACYPRNWSRVSWLLRRVAGQRCVWCGSSRRLQVHHMGVDYPNGNAGSRKDKHDLRVENLYVLCGQCHTDIEQWLRDWEADRLAEHRSLGIGVGLIVFTG